MTVQLKKLSPMHKQVLSLLAQGVPRGTIALACDITPEYVTMLASQEVCQPYLRQMAAAADAHLESLFGRSVEVIAETLNMGTPDEKLRAARLQLEATKRLGHNQISGVIEHKHSLLTLLSSLPPKGIRELEHVAAPLDVEDAEVLEDLPQDAVDQVAVDQVPFDFVREPMQARELMQADRSNLEHQ